MLKGKKSEYETSWIYGIDELFVEIGMDAVSASAGCNHTMVVTKKDGLDQGRGFSKAGN